MRPLGGIVEILPSDPFHSSVAVSESIVQLNDHAQYEPRLNNNLLELQHFCLSLKCSEGAG